MLSYFKTYYSSLSLKVHINLTVTYILVYGLNLGNFYLYDFRTVYEYNIIIV